MSKKMIEMKKRLVQKYGERCEVCGKSYKLKDLTGHHIVMKCKGGEISERNILLVCKYCHFEVINKMNHDSEEYWELMHQSLKKRKGAIG